MKWWRHTSLSILFYWYTVAVGGVGNAGNSCALFTNTTNTAISKSRKNLLKLTITVIDYIDQLLFTCCNFYNLLQSSIYFTCCVLLSSLFNSSSCLNTIPVFNKNEFALSILLLSNWVQNSFCEYHWDKVQKTNQSVSYRIWSFSSQHMHWQLIPHF